MGLRQAFGRWRTGHTDPSGRAPDDSRPTSPRSRHQADPATGELIRLTGDPDSPGGSRDLTVDDSPDGTSTEFSDVAAAPLPPERPELRPEPRPQPGPPADAGPGLPRPAPAGGLVVGRADLRHRAEELPASYSRTPLPYDRTAVRRAWDLLGDRTDKLVVDFYAELFLRLGNDALTMFPAGMSGQRQEFGKALIQWVVADDPDAMSAHLAQLGADHRKYEVAPAHYDVAAQALVGAWRGLLGEQWTPEIERAVTGSYTRLASTMIDGALAARDEPVTWGATVVAHERLGRDFAVVTLQPDNPYLFRAGQYLTVELAQRPREWRRMSVASAPRPDNTLELQVRAVNATGVAAAMVMHTRVGDRVRLGPPRGNNLVVEPGTLGPGGLLCIASGTGTAPMIAVVESLLAWPQCPPVYLFTGARTAADLHPAERLARTVDATGRSDQVQIYGVVSRDPGYTGLRGKVEDVVPTLKDWAQLGVDVLVAGPDTMIQTTVFGLVGRGVRDERIRFDQYDSAE